MKSDKREKMNASCGVQTWDEESKQYRTEFPAVRCNYKCDTCGFSHAEQQRRLTEGRMETRHVVHKLHDDNGCVINVVENDCQTLIFNRGTVNA